MWPIDPTNPESSDSVTPKSGRSEIPEPLRQESDFAELAAKLEARAGGRIPAELSGELALDIVLNEIVEQACLATGANGAAIALRRGDEMVCRASSGRTAPELGSRLDTNEGLSATCVRTRQIQCCDDVLTDARADPGVSRELGMRSVVVYPVLRDDDVMGILEVFSSRPAAFGDRDLQTLKVLADRILANTGALEASRIAAASTLDGEPTPAEQNQPDAASEGRTQLAGEANEADFPTPPRFDWFTALAGAIIVSVALLMGAVFIMRLGLLRHGENRRTGRSSTESGETAGPPSPNPPPVAGERVAEAQTTELPATARTETGGENGRVPEGGLRIFENGKEVFRMPATVEKGSAAEKEIAKVPSNPGSVVRRVEPEYPEQARAQGLQGDVVLDLHIGRAGEVQEVKLLSGSPLLANAAIAAARQWQFKPHVVKGRPVDVYTEITLKFTLPPK